MMPQSQIFEGLQLAIAYIRYVQSEEPRLHERANGTPPILTTLENILKEGFTSTKFLGRVSQINQPEGETRNG